MNEKHISGLTITITGTLTFADDQLEQLLSRMPAAILPMARPPLLKTPTTKIMEDDGKLPRLAYTMRETAEILGVSYMTVYRLLQRGLLKSSLALRCKIIAKSEIERFLKETSRSVY